MGQEFILFTMRRCLSSLLLLFILPFLLLLLSTTAMTDEQARDQISALPGQPPVAFLQFSGYVTVNKEHGRALFYWLTEAASYSAKKPLVLWLNGGPGCSSVAYGASEEIGPFRINKTGSSLYLNKFSWNREANLLFLESPAGVGFSYTDTVSDLKNSGDERTAQDALMFLIHWMSRFPQYKNRDFYISGESYAGHYVPQLAKKIVEYNKASLKPFINLKGILVGNAVTDNYFDSIGTISYWWTHSMISDQTYRSILSSCNFSSPKASHECDHVVSYAMNHEFGDIDQYSIYTPSCVASSPKNTTRQHKIRFKNTLIHGRSSFGYDPCTENYSEKYYNRQDVQKAMHANTTGIPYKWTACSDILIKTWADTQISMLPTYKELIAAGLRIWMFRYTLTLAQRKQCVTISIVHCSGDIDSVVPVTATRFAISHLRLKIKIPWYPWYLGRQVGGWTEVYEGMTFASVRGAGHEVPLLQPKRAFQLFASFLAGKPLPTS
ncbi:serine carboxypeptidase 24 isoform X1 [Zingiber officinale]|uniref:serine carboxypeptidase 24 isoform X1 n=1 Tax=Zingiber officinale TaxID=94328 RepID=UPI001C4BF299|nr:serine carboxypeptidase 24 isoform X1 [Zingiber officinale]